MPKNTYRFPNSAIVGAQISGSSYETGTIALLFHPDSFPANTLELIEILSESHKLLSRDLEREVPIAVFEDIENCRALFNKLIELGAIHNSDIPTTGLMNQEVDKHLRGRLQFNPRMRIQKASKEILLSLAEVYIDDIIENTTNHHDALNFICCGFSQITSYISEEKLIQFTKFRNVEDSILGSVEALFKINFGHAELENTFTRMGSAIPSLLEQRNIIFRSCVDKLLDRYKDISDEEKVLIIVTLELFRRPPGDTIHPLQDLKNNLRQALAEPIDSKLTEMNFGSAEGIVQAFGLAIGIVFPNQGYIENFKGLQRSFNSPLLLPRVKINEDNLAKRNVESQSFIMKGLKSNDTSLINQGLEAKEDINQYFLDQFTPLLYAISNCTDDVIEFLILHKADVNKMAANGLLNPLRHAINLAALSKVILLVDAGANVFSTYKRRTNVSNYKFQNAEIPVAEAPIIMAAFDSHRDKPSSDTKAIAKYMLHNGAGFEVNFTEFPELFDKAVIIGGSCPIKEGIRPVKDVNDFIKYIDPQDYSHWLKVFSRRLAGWRDRRSSHGIHLMQITRHIDTHQNTSIASTGVIRQTYSGAPHTASGDAHTALLRRVEGFVNNSNSSFKPFLDAIKQKEYSKALRRACTTADPKGFELIKILFEYEKHLKIDVNEKAGPDELTCLHYCGKINNRTVYAFLLTKEANPHLLDRHGNKAIDLSNNKFFSIT